MLLVLERVLESENAAPRVAEQIEVVPIESECLANLLYFLDRARDGPELRRVRLIAVERAELIVEVVFDPGGGEIAVECLEVFVRGPWSAVEQQQLDPRIIADALGP